MSLEHVAGCRIKSHPNIRQRHHQPPTLRDVVATLRCNLIKETPRKNQQVVRWIRAKYFIAADHQMRAWRGIAMLGGRIVNHVFEMLRPNPTILYNRVSASRRPIAGNRTTL